MKILLLGKDGQLGWELQRSLAPLGSLTALGRHSQTGLCGDLSDLSGLKTTLRQLKPDVIVNAAAYTAVDRAEGEHALATRINAEAPAILAEEAKALGALLVHYSTDYVFDGSGNTPKHEEDTPFPLNHYGVSKLAGERVIQATGCRYLIFRTSWVYAARGQNFLATMRKLIQQRPALKVVGDQVGAPTGAELIADASTHAIHLATHNKQLEGLYHLAAKGETSWHGYAVYIAEYLQELGVNIMAKPDAIQAIPSSEWPTPAQRPLNSRLDTRKFEKAFGLLLPPWQAGVERVLAEYHHFNNLCADR